PSPTRRSSDLRISSAWTRSTCPASPGLTNGSSSCWTWAGCCPPASATRSGGLRGNRRRMSTFELTPEEMELFLTEAAEQVDTMEELLVDLEKGAEPDAVSAIFRAAHTLKGGAATAGMNQTARLTHALESLLDQIRSGQRDADPDTVDALLEAVDMLRTCLTVIEEHGTDAGVDVGPLSERLEALVAGVPAEDGPERASGEAPAAAEGAGAEAPSPAVDPSLAALAREAAAAGQRVLVVRVTVETGAAMPSIRLYQTLMVLDEAGRLVRTEPSREQIEDPASEHWHLEAVLVTAHSPDEVRAALGEASCLERVEIEEAGVPAAGAAGRAGGAEPGPERPGRRGGQGPCAAGRGSGASGRVGRRRGRWHGRPRTRGQDRRTSSVRRGSGTGPAGGRRCAGGGERGVRGFPDGGGRGQLRGHDPRGRHRAGQRAGSGPPDEPGGRAGHRSDAPGPPRPG